MLTLLNRLKKGEVVVADGALGTMLFQSGLSPGDCPEMFNLTHPSILEEIAIQYKDAGAEIIQTNTFGGSKLKLANYNLDSRAEEINRSAVKTVKSVSGDNAYVSASCGPSGEMLYPLGEVSKEDMFKNFYDQIKILIEAGADLICIETMTDINEAAIAVKAAKSISSEIPVMATMTFDKIPKGYYTIMGVSIEKAVDDLTLAGADILGSNCGHGIDNMIGIAHQFKKLSNKPILIQSNAGLPLRENDNLVYPETPSYFADKVKSLIDEGVSIIGGCCGTTPDHIRAIRKIVDFYPRKSS
jgi:5-methyltetrahydrofolate--homocysteine methyltransferase